MAFRARIISVRWATVTMAPCSERERRKLKRALKELSAAVTVALRTIDQVMKEPEGELRGKRIAAAMNALEMANDQARYFHLGVNFRTDRKSR